MDISPSKQKRNIVQLCTIKEQKWVRPNILMFPFLTKPVLLWLLDPGGPHADHPDEQNQQDDEDNSASDAWGGLKMETILAWSLSHLQQCRQTPIWIRNLLPWNFQHIGSRRLHICPSRKRPEDGRVKKENLYKIKVKYSIYISHTCIIYPL